MNANRVQVPFTDIAPAADAVWSLDTGDELRVPIGRTGATKLQYLCLGKGTRQHALVAGKTGSGKSTLFHVIITNLALWCSPEEVEFYLVDFKKGVEFKTYATHKLPHARVIAIESDREFGLSVLQRVDDELKRRGHKVEVGGDAPITVNADVLASAGLLKTRGKPLKVLGSGELKTKVFVLADYFTESAISKITKAGGSTQVYEAPAAAAPAPKRTPKDAARGGAKA